MRDLLLISALSLLNSSRPLPRFSFVPPNLFLEIFDMQSGIPYPDDYFSVVSHSGEPSLPLFLTVALDAS